MNKPNTNLPVECFNHWLKEMPDRDYLVQPMPDGEVVHLTWKQVDDQARRFAAFLQAQDFPPKSQIALMSSNTAWWVIADLGIWMAGHVSVPLYPDLATDTIDYILDHSEAKLLVVGKLAKWEEMKGGVPENLPTLSTPLHPADSFTHSWDDVLNHEPIAELAERDPEEMATMVYTSGSTGRPKGVMLSFAALQATPQSAKGIVDIYAEDRMISYLPLAHIYERSNVQQASLYHGFTVYFSDSLATFQQDLQRARPTQFISVPRLWVKFQEGVNQKIPPNKQKILFKLPIVGKHVKHKVLETLGLDQVRFAVTASAPLAPEIVVWYQNVGLDLLECYGMSENFGLSHYNRPGQSRPGTVGTAGPGVDHQISEKGEILVRSPANMLGYFKNPEKTAEELTEDGWLMTGDMGEIDADGYLKITGRLKELFKTSKGKYIAPAPIENQLTNISGIEAACVSGENREQPHALLLIDADYAKGLGDKAAKEAYATELENSIKAINATLDHHEQLAFGVVVKDQWTIDNGYLTPTMKIKRAAIEKAYTSKSSDWYAAKQAVIWE